ncbi:peroxiredoxin [Caulobacter sp. S45]|jgi:peroxiredoxin Q/BCP|uniref:peroxiredoxin n=1 Tax=Caulobacter sp. S45 TaxID=1641861 RepID=UPI00131E695E|nr:peroxiredoxin [Caulobacter sp. S45]
MKRFLAALALAGAVASPAMAALTVGASAPDFTTQATIGGKQFTFSLAEALKKGPVVLYFYPAAFTKGCTIEAHEFAANIDKFKAMHATVIGVSADDIEKLDKFSVSECQSKFPVAADPTFKVIKAYDTLVAFKFAARTSYVIAPGGKVLYTYTDGNPDHHVENALTALKTYQDEHG